jgi:hypothetical protein
MKQIVKASAQKNTLESRKIKALLGLQQRGIVSQNITRAIMSRAGLSSTNETGQRVSKPMTEKSIQSQKVLNVFKKTVDIFRQMNPYVNINFRSTPKDGKYRVNMTFGYKTDVIKGWRNTYFEHNQNTGFHREYAGYVPIKAVFTVSPRQLYITRVTFGKYETEDNTFGPMRVFGSSFEFPELHDFGLISQNNVLSNRRQYALIDRALLIHAKGGTKKFTKLQHNNFNRQENFGYYDNGWTFNTVQSHAIEEYTNDINKAKRRMNIEKKARQQKAELLNNLRSLPPLRTQHGKLYYPGGNQSRQSLTRAAHIANSDLPKNLTDMWKRLGIESRKRPRNLNRPKKRSQKPWTLTS